MKHLFAEDLSVEELKEMVRRLRRKNDCSWLHVLVIVLGAVAVVGIVAAVVVKLTTGKCCDDGCCCEDDEDCDDYEDEEDDENGCRCANDDDFVKE